MNEDAWVSCHALGALSRALTPRPSHPVHTPSLMTHDSHECVLFFLLSGPPPSFFFSGRRACVQVPNSSASYASAWSATA